MLKPRGAIVKDAAHTDPAWPGVVTALTMAGAGKPE
jgi:hypothetical protein